jgi:hypothetical protein
MASRRFRNISPPSQANMMPALQSVCDVVGHITAQSQPVIQQLGANATLPEVIAKLNEVLARLQGTP